MNLYLLTILSYMYTACPVIKAFPCVLLFLETENYAFLFASAGDYFLATEKLLPGILSFGISNLMLFPPEALEQFTTIPFIIIQPPLIYAFGWYAIFVNMYVYTLLNMLSRKTLPTTLFVLSDIFVLLQFLGYNVSYISLPLYWTAMWLFTLVSTAN
jgi:hypothetical protein